tara:strand:+ start:594 stop:773 length:180 start_codon:yes stop_codon:yes gene_type:complete
MSSNSKLFEEYGYKSHDLGMFNEWREITSSILSKNPKMDQYMAGEIAYYQLIGSRKNND